MAASHSMEVVREVRVNMEEDSIIINKDNTGNKVVIHISKINNNSITIRDLLKGTSKTDISNHLLINNMVDHINSHHLTSPSMEVTGSHLMVTPIVRDLVNQT